MLVETPAGSTDLDLDVCAREPIHISGAIQPHGHLLACDDTPALELVHASIAAASALLPDDLTNAIGRPLLDVLRIDAADDLSQVLRALPERGVSQLGRVRSSNGGAVFDATAHKSLDGLVIIELHQAVLSDSGGRGLSPMHDSYPLLRSALQRLAGLSTIEAMLDGCLREIRAISGFDRALIYRFEENWDGVVVAEDGNGRLPSYAGLRFPASDIPAQARQLYTLNHIRTIPDADAAPVPIFPDRHRRTGRPLDLSLATLRSVSPLHLEYMRNMGTAASMSIALAQAGSLWGLISCHHAGLRQISPATIAACDLLARFVEVRIAGLEQASRASETIRLKSIESRLLADMAVAPGSIADRLSAITSELCGFVYATGVAVVTQQGCHRAGRTLPETNIRQIANALDEKGVADVFATNALATVLPDATADSDIAGLLAIRISRLHPDYILWFRPELIRTVLWAGDPDLKSPSRAATVPDGRVGPRQSFAAWMETVRGTAQSWSDAQMAAARELRSAIVDIVLKQAEERAQLIDQLERTNAELAAFSYSVSHDLRAPFRHIVGYAELLLERDGKRLDDKARRFISVIIESAQTAGLLVDALLNFSRMGSTQLAKTDIDTTAIVQSTIDAQSPDLGDREIEWKIGPLPTVSADPIMLRQIFFNLLSNAVKYTRETKQAEIEIGCSENEREYEFFVRDNGIGFEMIYAHKLFGVFQRLQRVEDYEGVGIGLANVRRMMERHNGRTWAHGVLQQGATFYFTLPRTEPHAKDARSAATA